MEVICATCRYWKKNPYSRTDENGKEVYYGDCHCKPPQVYGHLTKFPETISTEWCGEHSQLYK